MKCQNKNIYNINKINQLKIITMPARTQRTHYMGFSNRDTNTFIKQGTQQLFERSFMKSKSQYHPPTKKNTVSFIDNPNKLQPINNTQNLNQTFSNTNTKNDINDLYKNSEKGHHYQFESQRFNSSSKRPFMYKKYIPLLANLPLDFSEKLNSQIQEQIKEFSGKEISFYKVRELKQAFLRNNKNRKNLNELYSKFSNHDGLIDQKGFNNLIKYYGYDLNHQQVNVMFKLNNLHNGMNTKDNSQVDQQTINLNDFVNLMTKQNIYFKTLKLQAEGQNYYKFSDSAFQILRNKFSKLKQSLKIHQNEQIDREKFQKIMKKLDITDLVLKQDKRVQIFNKFTNEHGILNPESLLGAIAIQQNSNKQSKISTGNNFDKNLMVKEEQAYTKLEKDPLGNKINPLNLKKNSICEYEKNLKFAKQICQNLKQIEQKSGRNIANQIFRNQSLNGVLNRQVTYKNVEKVLQSSGYNYNKNQYKAFLSYLDFDSNDLISKKNFEKFVFNENQKEIVDRLDRRKRAPKAYQQNNHEQNQECSESNVNHFNGLAANFRSRSCADWMKTKKSFIKESNMPEFNIPNKYSAWPDRLYESNLSMIQPQKITAMVISQSERFQKNQKHSYGQQQKQKKQRIHENKIRKTSDWQNNLLNRLQIRNQEQQQKNLSKNYNMRLLKEQYQNRCHNTVNV